MDTPIRETELLPIVRGYLGDEALELSDVTWAPLGHQILNPTTGGLYRVSGTARAAGRTLPWSLVLKSCRPMLQDPSDSTNWNYWRREVEAYQSPLPYRLPPGARPPRLAGVIPESETLVHLLVEEVQGDRSPQGWSLAEEGALAEHLGQWAAIPLFEPLQADWLCPAPLRGMMQTGRILMQLPEMQGIWDKPHIAPHFEWAAGKVERLLERAEMLHQRLEALPQVIGHMDAHRENLIRQPVANGGTQFVLLDWSTAGRGAVGEELGHLFSSNLLRGYVTGDRAPLVATELVSGYARGLAQAGAAVDLEAVRLGFTISVVLRSFGFALPLILRMGADPANQAAAAYAPILSANARPLLPYLEEALSLAS